MLVSKKTLRRRLMSADRRGPESPAVRTWLLADVPLPGNPMHHWQSYGGSWVTDQAFRSTPHISRTAPGCGKKRLERGHRDFRKREPRGSLGGWP